MEWILIALAILATFAISFALAHLGLDLFCYLFGSRPRANTRSDIRRQIRYTGRNARRAMDQASEEYLRHLQKQV